MSINRILFLGLMSSVCFVQASAITAKEIQKAQKAWGDCIVAIGQEPTKEKSTKTASECIDKLYAYSKGSDVLFKPTKASDKEFRLNKKEALSYFVTGEIEEDHGFALQPWSKVRFENADEIIDSNSAIAMGNYYFTDAKTNKEVKVDYTFGYIKDKKGHLKINLHHSSLPFEHEAKH
jgi:hypothetical protein